MSQVLPRQLSKGRMGLIVTIASAVIFGFYPPATRAVYADGGNAVFIVLLTTFARAFSLLLFCIAKGLPVLRTWPDIRTGMVNGIFQTLSIIGILGGMAFLPGPLVIIILFSYTLMLYGYIVCKKEEPFNKATLLLVFMALVGLALSLNVQNNFKGLRWEGVALAFIAALATATRVYAFGRLSHSKAPTVIGAETFLFVLLFSCSLLFFNAPLLPTTINGAIWAGVAALSLSLGSFGTFYGIALLGAFKFSFFVKLEPIFGALFCALFINETLSYGQYIGMAIVVGSLISYQYLQQRSAAGKNGS